MSYHPGRLDPHLPQQERTVMETLAIRALAVVIAVAVAAAMKEANESAREVREEEGRA